MDLKIYQLRLTEVSAYSNEFGDESQKLVMNYRKLYAMKVGETVEEPQAND